MTSDVLDAIFKAYDVRGTVPDQLDAGLCRAIGAAFARFASETEGATRVLVGRDMRPTGAGPVPVAGPGGSGTRLTQAFSDGVCSGP